MTLEFSKVARVTCCNINQGHFLTQILFVPTSRYLMINEKHILIFIKKYSYSSQFSDYYNAVAKNSLTIS